MLDGACGILGRPARLVKSGEDAAGLDFPIAPVDARPLAAARDEIDRPTTLFDKQALDELIDQMKLELESPLHHQLLSTQVLARSCHRSAS